MMVHGMIEMGSTPLKARIAGLLYLLTIVTGILAQFLGNGLVVSGDPTATAANILGHETQFRLAFVADFVMTASYIAVTGLFYEIFKPVNRSLSLIAALFSIVGCAALACSLLFYLAVPVALAGGSNFAAFQANELQALATLLLKLNARAYDVALVFFGPYCLLLGWLIFKSGFLPRVLGLLMALAGLGWVTFVWPPLSSSLSPFNSLPGLIGEGSLALWLAIRGVGGVTANNSFKPKPLRGSA